ncbi:unnamed protein product [Soboliphyme baturini]|uniref:Secreted protein n=1 Tax=Soboliphyme baturini TaxID=241478 RepID=A0A183IIQ6_9BILA|nr:unnamed protein product [Soboliphyme baturini]
MLVDCCPGCWLPRLPPPPLLMSSTVVLFSAKHLVIRFAAVPRRHFARIAAPHLQPCDIVGRRSSANHCFFAAPPLLIGHWLVAVLCGGGGSGGDDDGGSGGS